MIQKQLKDKQGDADLAGSHQRSKALLGPSIGGERKEFEGFNADEIYRMFVETEGKHAAGTQTHAGEI